MNYFSKTLWRYAADLYALTVKQCPYIDSNMQSLTCILKIGTHHNHQNQKYSSHIACSLTCACLIQPRLNMLFLNLIQKEPQCMQIKITTHALFIAFMAWNLGSPVNIHRINSYRHYVKKININTIGPKSTWMLFLVLVKLLTNASHLIALDDLYRTMMN